MGQLVPQSRRVAAVAVLLTIAAASAYLWWVSEANPFRRGFEVGETVAEITMVGLGGEAFSLRGRRGEVVVLEFMATWCRFCALQHRELITLHENVQDVFIVSIEVDPSLGEEAFEEWATAVGFDWLVGHSPRAGRTYRVSKLPTVLVVDREGIIQYRGHYTSADQLEMLIRQYQ